jgi:hypothetical protein
MVVGDLAATAVDGVGIALIGLQGLDMLNHVQINGEPLFKAGGDYFEYKANEAKKQDDMMSQWVAGSYKAAAGISYGADSLTKSYENFENTGGVLGHADKDLGKVQDELKQQGAAPVVVGTLQGEQKAVEVAKTVSNTAGEFIHDSLKMEKDLLDPVVTGIKKAANWFLGLF